MFCRVHLFVYEGYLPIPDTFCEFCKTCIPLPNSSIKFCNKPYIRYNASTLFLEMIVWGGWIRPSPSVKRYRGSIIIPWVSKPVIIRDGKQVQYPAPRYMRTIAIILLIVY